MSLISGWATLLKRRNRLFNVLLTFGLVALVAGLLAWLSPFPTAA